LKGVLQLKLLKSTYMFSAQNKFYAVMLQCDAVRTYTDFV
jgi:hypothetical protein